MLWVVSVVLSWTVMVVFVLSDVMVVLSRLSVTIWGLVIELSRTLALLSDVTKVLGSSSVDEGVDAEIGAEDVWVDVGSEMVTSIVVTLRGRVTTGLRREITTAIRLKTIKKVFAVTERILMKADRCLGLVKRRIWSTRRCE